MDAMRNESANATEPGEDGAEPPTPTPTAAPGAQPEAAGATDEGAKAEVDAAAETPSGASDEEAEPGTSGASGSSGTSGTSGTSGASRSSGTSGSSGRTHGATASPGQEAPPTSSVEVPQQRTAEPEAASGGKGKKRKSAPKSKTAGVKSLVVFRDGKVHYADDTVVVLDLDEAAHPDTDVHDVVDKLSELRDAAESPGRTEAVALVAELIQNKALA